MSEKENKRTEDNILTNFIKQEVPWRLRNILGLELDDELESELISYIDNNTDVMFDYDKFDQALYEKYEELRKVRSANTMINVILVKPMETPEVITINDDLETLQKIVGGNIEMIKPFADDVALICNEEGKMMGMPLNRSIYSIPGQVVDIIAGPFLVAYAPVESEQFLSLPEELEKKYMKLFREPETFINKAGNIYVIKNSFK